MRPRHFVILAIAAIVSTVVAFLTSAARDPWGSGTVAGVKLLPSLPSDVGRIAAIEIRQGGQTLTVEKAAAGWGLKDRAGYPVEIDKVRALLVQLAEAELIEPKTRKADRYDLIQLEDPAGKEAKSRLVRLLDGKGAPVSEVVLGKKRWDAFGSGKGGTYVRKPGDPQTWLASAELEPSASVKDWVKPVVFETASSAVSRLTVELAGEEPLQVVRGEDKKLAIAGVPDGKKLKDAMAAQTLVRAASSIEMEDVRKLDAAPTGNGVNVVKLEADGGLAVTLRLRKDGDAHWLSISATGEGDAKKTADEIGGRAAVWEFKVPSSKAEALLKRRADLFETS